MDRGKNNRNKFFRGRGKFFYRNRGRGRGDNKNQNQNDQNASGSANNNNSQNITPISSKPTPKQIKITSFTVTDSPYPGWKLYFPDEGYADGSITHNKVKAVEDFIKKNTSLFTFTTIQESRNFTIDLKVLLNDQDFNSSWNQFETDLRDHPTHSINCVGLAMHQIIWFKLDEEMKKDLPDGQEPESINLPVIRARIINFGPVIQLKHLKTNYYGKLVSIKGTIIRIGNIKLISVWLAFQCSACEALQCVKQLEGVYTMPSSCTSEGCKCRTFTPLKSSPFTQTVNWQKVRLQEIVDEQRESGRVPRTIECELTADLVESCSPGDIVTLTGIIKIRNEDEASRRKSASVFQLYLDVVTVVNSQSAPGVGRTAVEFNVKDYYAIREIHAQERLFRLIVQSLCPQIYGHEVVKAGLTLGLFGGCQRYLHCRADPHILVVGDPGLGKSRMLQACANVSPRGVYVCGNTSTSSGLTVTLNRESGGDYALEAGALVLSDQGCCCIDEFDKMSTQHQALLEAMEQQTVSIAKAGVLCSLPARTSILAAANPVGGHYNKAKTVSENLKLGPALLSRFDLVFILLDQPNQDLDNILSEHVLALHSGAKSNTSSLSESFQASGSVSNQESIKERLKAYPGEVLDKIPHPLLRKYIAYARKYVKPKIGPEAAKVLENFYLELRKRHKDNDCTPVTTRQLESLIRLTEARAKAELREEASESDAKDVVEIFKCSMIDTFSDQFGSIDFNRSQHGSGMSSKNQAKKFISVLQRRAELQARSVFSVQELKEVAQNASLSVADFSSFLAALNVQGYLLKKGAQLYQLLSVDY